MNLNATIIGQSIAFAFFVWFCMKYVWPPVVAILEERANKIAEGLHAADRAEQDLVLAQERSSEQIKKAKQEGPLLSILRISERLRLSTKPGNMPERRASALLLVQMQKLSKRLTAPSNICENKLQH